ncbi:SDR family oxidoreductase [Candidatus Micrarchaeota archaeon]|nr:SDR family oxidoreductase [Candidatus Micrarchaeota archaeon]
MKILVTGGAGFIGSHLCERLAGEGNKVICVDNLSTGRKENVEGIANVEFVKQDVTKQFEVKCEQVYNLASPASPVDYRNLSVETLLVGSVGVQNVLECARKNNARMLHASTSEVYGDPQVHPQVETYFGNVNPIGPRSCYDEAKRYAEALCIAYHSKKLANVVLARIFNTYGPRMRLDDGRVVPNFVGQALRGEPITVYGDGKQTRSFCFVSDQVEALVKLMNSKFSGEAFNSGNPEEHTILEFAQRIKQMTKSESEIVFKPLPQDDPKKRKPDITKIKKAIGWQPKVELDEGLKKTIEWFKQKI